MRVLVTGASGFVGGHALPEFRRAGHDVIAMVMPGEAVIPGVLATEALDLGDAAGLTALVARHQPDACLHLAGMAFVPTAWKNPVGAFQVNVIGTLHLLEAFRAHAPAARFLTVSSAQLYGHAPRAAAIREDEPPIADSIYAVSKWSADISTLLYHQRYGQHTMTARPCNHIGPRQSESFVVASFARQLLDIRAGKRSPVMRVGNLASRREFTDVRDVVRAYRLLLEKGHAGQAYNVASGQFITIQSIFDTLCRLTGVSPDVEIDPALYRPTDAQPVIDFSRLQEHTGWKAEISLEETLRDVIADLESQI